MFFCIEYLYCLCAIQSLEYRCMFTTIKDYEQMNAQNIKENIQQFSRCELKMCKGIKLRHETLNTATFEY